MRRSSPNLAEPRRTSCERIYAYANCSYRSHGLSTASYLFAHIYSMVLKVPLLHVFHPISNRRLLTPSAQCDSHPISLSLQDHVPRPSHDVPDRDPCFLSPRNTRDIIQTSGVGQHVPTDTQIHLTFLIGLHTCKHHFQCTICIPLDVPFLLKLADAY